MSGRKECSSISDAESSVFAKGTGTKAHHLVPSAPGYAHRADYILKPRVAPEWVHSRVHLDPWQSSGFIADASCQGFQGLFFFVQVSVGSGQQKAANIF